MSVAMLTHRLLAAVRADCAEAWSLLRQLGAELSIRVSIGAERFAVLVGEDGPRLRARVAGAAVVDVETRPRVLCAVISGERDLVSALETGALSLRGAPADLVRLDDFVRVLVSGAARSHRAAGLFDELLRLAEENP